MHKRLNPNDCISTIDSTATTFNEAALAVRSASMEYKAFAFHVKRVALGPHIASKWGWDDALQRRFHDERWLGRSWFIIEYGGCNIGTVSVNEFPEHIQFGEFYIFPEYQGKGVGTIVLRRTLDDADLKGKIVKLECLQWNPVLSLYIRHGFSMVSKNDTHYFMIRDCGRRGWK